MTVVNHALTGAALMLALAKLFFGSLSPVTFWVLLVYGLIAGSLPDTLDWFLWFISGKKLQRWAITYGWFHKTKMGHLVSALLIAPLPHVLGDHFIHPPVLANKGTDPYGDEILIEKPIKLSRHDILWLLGELMMFLFFIILVGIYLWPS
jgi:hypothetical protein